MVNLHLFTELRNYTYERNPQENVRYLAIKCSKPHHYSIIIIICFTVKNKTKQKQSNEIPCYDIQPHSASHQHHEQM